MLVVATLALLLGGGLSHIFRKKIKRLLNRKQKEMDEIINDPDLLVEKLSQNGKMVDSGEELKYSVVEEGGVRKVALEKTKVKPEPSLSPTGAPRKKVVKKKVVVKKINKKGSKG